MVFEYDDPQEIIEWLDPLLVVFENDDPRELIERLDFLRLTEYEEEFLFSTCFSPGFVSKLMYHGFLPMSDGAQLFMPKLHHFRSIVHWPELHIQKRARNKSKKYTFTVNSAFKQVIEKLIQFHGEECWINPLLASTFSTLRSKQFNAQVHTFELWSDSELIAGELGYQVGSLYTSLSGFSDRRHQSAGFIQMYCMAAILKGAKFQAWDMGMIMPYKENIGALNLPRHDFLRLLTKLRSQEPKPLHTTVNSIPGFELIETLFQ